MIRRLLLLVFSVSVVALLVVTPALAERRALVIGNDAYVHVDRLRNAVADARAMARALEGAGFKVEPPVLDAGRGRMFEAITRFSEGLGHNDEAVVFYAGHAVELKGVNYLLPVDIQGDSERSVAFDAVPLSYLLSSVADQRPKFSLMVIDACRDNPFKGEGRNLASRGLVPAGAAAAGQMVIYSASEGQKALDRLGPDDQSPNGVFTRVFVKAIETPDIPVHEAMRRVKSEVKRLADSVRHRQLPAIYDATEGDFYFRGSRGNAAQTAPPPTGRDEDAETYEAASATGTADALEQYLAAFPRGRFAAAARIRIAALRQSGAAAVSRPGAVTPPPGASFSDCDGCPTMVVIPGGRFVMGSPQDEPDREASEGPQRPVEVARFGLGRTEVTRVEFHAFLRATGRAVNGCHRWDGKAWSLDATRSWGDPGYPQAADHPVTCVSQEDARAYAKWLSQRTGHTYRLPSEAEWEYAARAGSRTARYWGLAESEACRFENVADRSTKRSNDWWAIFECDDGYEFTAPAGRYRANAFGLHDMLGNVWEWTTDCWNPGYEGAPQSERPWTTGNCARRVVRGGNWADRPGSVRAARRNSAETAWRLPNLGFRVARSLP